MKLGRARRSVCVACGALGRLLLRPPALGACYLLALTALASDRPIVDESERVLGADTGTLVRLVRVEFADVIRDIGIALGAVAIAAGACLGLAAAVLMTLRDSVLGRDRGITRGSYPGRRRLPLRAAARALLLIAALHALLMLRSMATWPALYERSWYRQGGVAAWVQLFATDVAGPELLAAAAGVLVVGYALGLPQLCRRWPERARRALRALRRAASPRRVTLAAALAIGLAALVAGSRPARRPPSAYGTRPNVLIVAADSLRHDRLDAASTPVLSALGARAVRFDRAYWSLARTFSSWVTLLTGRHPHHHGIRSMFARAEERAGEVDALPARLRAAGYRTAVVSDYAGDMFSLLDLGFETVRAPGLDFRELIRRRAVEQATVLLPFLQSRLGRRLLPVVRSLSAGADPGWLADDAIALFEQPDGRPFFLTLFFSTSHFPYAAPWPYYARFAIPGYAGPFKYQKAQTWASTRLGERDVRQVRGLYDGAVASVDAAIGRVLTALARQGLAETTIVVATSDHGEMLFEHDRLQGHGNHLFGDEVLHVPLLVLDPRRPGARRVPAIVRDVDVAPTLYELTAVAPPLDVDGRSLGAAWRSEALAPAYAFAESELWLTDLADVPCALRLPYPTVGGLLAVDRAHDDQLVLRGELTAVTLVARHRMARDERFKLVYVPLRRGARYLLFDTDRDPAERDDVAATHPAEVARLRDVLWRWMLSDRSMTEEDGRLLPRAGPCTGGATP